MKTNARERRSKAEATTIAPWDCPRCKRPPTYIEAANEFQCLSCGLAGWTGSNPRLGKRRRGTPRDWAAYWWNYEVQKLPGVMDRWLSRPRGEGNEQIILD